MDILAQAVAGLLTAFVTALDGWVYNLNSRITVLETKEAAQDKLVAAREDGLKAWLEEKFSNMAGRLGRIERSLNGSHADFGVPYGRPDR